MNTEGFSLTRRDEEVRGEEEMRRRESDSRG